MESGPPHVRAGATASFAVLVLAYGAFAWREAEDRVLEAAAAEGRAVLAGVAAGVGVSLEASRAVEGLLAERLARDAAAIDASLAESPGEEENVLLAATQARDLTGAILLDARGEVVAEAPSPALDPAPVDGPFPAERVARLARGDLARRAREADLGASGVAVLRFGEGPFSPRGEFVVAVRAPRSDGTLVLRADAASLERFERDAGVRRHLSACAREPAVAYLAIQAEDGRVLAGDPPPGVPPPSGQAAWRPFPGGGRVLDVAFPPTWDGPPRGWLRVGLDAAPVEEVLSRSRRNVVVLSLLAAGAGVGAALALGAVERRRRAEEAALRAEIERGERLVALGSLAAAVAHEIRGPLNAVSLAVQLLDREARPSEPAARGRFDGHLAALRDAVRRADAHVAEFLALGRGGTEPERVPVDLADVVRDAVAAEAPGTGLDAPGARVVVAGDRRVLVRAVSNLLRNAVQWAPVRSIRVAWRSEGRDAVLEVSDGGPGIPAADRSRVFEPFRSGRPGGTGLGLSIARDAVVRHGGTIEVADGAGGGALVRVRLPLRGAGR